MSAFDYEVEAFDDGSGFIYQLRHGKRITNYDDWTPYHGWSWHVDPLWPFRRSLWSALAKAEKWKERANSARDRALEAASRAKELVAIHHELSESPR